MTHLSPAQEHRRQRYALLSIWGFIAAIFLLTWCFTQALLPLVMAASILGPAVLFDILLRFVGKEKRSPLDWLVISPFPALPRADRSR